jgi:NAD+ kinase
MRRVLVVYKKSFLESHAQDRALLRRLPAALRRKYARADEENRAAIRDVVEFLERQHVRVTAVDRSSMAADPGYSLVVTVGGDGTFFAASHHVRSTPVLAVNSDPRNSLGLFACCDRTDFRGPLLDALWGRLEATRLNRLSVRINGAKVKEFVINDVLFAHRNPAAMSHYRISADGRREDQRSSGVWIADAGGSTAGIRAAGGVRMAIESTRIQWVVREPYGWPNADYRLRRGMASRSIELLVLMAEAAAWIDGARLRYDVKLGDRLRITTGATPLNLLGYDDTRRRSLFP